MGPVPRNKPAIIAPVASTAATNPLNPTNVQDAAADADTSMVDAPTAATQGGGTQDTKKRKRKEKEAHIVHQTTFRKPAWSYFHLTLITPGTAARQPSNSIAPSETDRIDALTVSTLLSQPLTAYLGTTGSAIPIDILHTDGRSAYIRIPRQDARGFRAALSGWIGGCDAGSVPGAEEGGGRVRVAWRVVAEGGSLGLLRGGGDEVFGEKGVAY
ncbi:hypothetical protein EKO04_000087 [Ascochyta lentis]|uniref:Ribonucleases P/MRP subunit Pop8-like domain-containing protein n=1 Tax=Ascochyta lentis TaxID=205686 RepID=A0A8H7JF55_9PLEO|nr:hypothetical protein EKO04_000087 [Ascochyta lentis]